MEAPAIDPTDQRALDAMQCSFYAGDLSAAESAGQALLANVDLAFQAGTDAVAAHAVRARALLWLVRCARRADALDTALARAAAGIASAQAAHQFQLECQLQAQCVHALTTLGQNETALEEGYKALRRAADSGDTLAQAACWLALGNVHWVMRQWSDSEQAYTQSLTLARLCGDREIGGLASNGIATIAAEHAAEARAAGRADEALANARRSLAMFDDFTRNSLEIGDGYNVRVGIYNQACCLFGMGEHARARQLLNQQLQALDGTSGSRRQLILQVLGDIHLAEGSNALAIGLHTEALAIAERLQLPKLAMDTCQSLVTALERMGDLRAALAQHRRYHAFYVQMASNKAQAHARAMAVMYETERTRAHAEAQRERAERLASANVSLVEEKAALQRSSMEDALTGLANRRHFNQALQQAQGADGSAPSHALAMIDVDHFKGVNDRFSHLVGDEVLRRLGALLHRCCRKQDLAARYGGEEFAVILADVDVPTARAACERLRAAVEAEPWWAVHADLTVTVSIGVAHARETQAAGERHDLLALADTRLYAAKRSGRNRVVDAAG